MPDARDMSSEPEHPQLPFERGLPETDPPKGKRRRRAPVALPTVSRWWRLRLWMRSYVKDVGYGVAVKIGVGTLVASGVVVGDQAFDVFGRNGKMKMPEEWPAVVIKSK